MADLDLEQTPPAIASSVYHEVERISGVADPYGAKKKESNRLALAIVDELRSKIAECGERGGLELAVRYAIAGNIIDYGAFHSFDIYRKLEECCEAEFVVDDRQQLFTAIENLTNSAKVLYLTDNCGEIVFDRLLIEFLHKKGAQITVATKHGPIINDALKEDAYLAGLGNYAQIIDNGTRCPGTVLAFASDEFLQHYRDSDLIISKGQGNFESLSEADEEIFFLLTVKCPAAARHMRELSGVDSVNLKGRGELAIYYSQARQ